MYENDFNSKVIVPKISISIFGSSLLFIVVFSFIVYVLAQGSMKNTGQQLLEMLSNPLIWIIYLAAFVIVFLMITLNKRCD